MLTVKLEINTLFTRKSAQSLAILMILLAARFLLTSKFLYYICTLYYILNNVIRIKEAAAMGDCGCFFDIVVVVVVSEKIYESLSIGGATMLSKKFRKTFKS